MGKHRSVKSNSKIKSKLEINQYDNSLLECLKNSKNNFSKKRKKRLAKNSIYSYRKISQGDNPVSAR